MDPLNASSASSDELDEVAEANELCDLDDNGEDREVCGICGLTLKNKRTLKRHVKTHSNEIHKCGICNKSFGDKYYLNRHIKNHYSDNVCQYCGKKFTLAQSLKRHEEAAHACKYKCGICEKRCSSKTVLAAHTEGHKGQEKSHDCQTCGRRFLYRSSLLRHTKSCNNNNNNNKETNLPIFECPICNKVFKKNRYLKQHGKVHSDPVLSCHLCGKTFRWQQCLQFHLKSCDK